MQRGGGRSAPARMAVLALANHINTPHGELMEESLGSPDQPSHCATPTDPLFWSPKQEW